MGWAEVFTWVEKDEANKGLLKNKEAFKFPCLWLEERRYKGGQETKEKEEVS